MKVWHALELEMARAAEPVIAGQLWLAGTTGIEVSEDGPDFITLRAWFDLRQDPEVMRGQLEKSLQTATVPLHTLRSVKSLEVADQDWLAEWKKGYEPVEVGQRLLIAPSWKRAELEASSRIIVEIDPGMAFGTGTHETTRGCLALLEGYWKGGSLLDVGTGTGILAISAAKLCPGRIVAIDIDPEAIAVAEENARINQVEDDINFEVNRLSSFHGDAFDLVVANLTADVLTSLASEISSVIRPRGRLITSGILTEQRDQVVEALTAHGCIVIESIVDGEWITIAFSL